MSQHINTEVLNNLKSTYCLPELMSILGILSGHFSYCLCRAKHLSTFSHDCILKALFKRFPALVHYSKNICRRDFYFPKDNLTLLTAI